MTTKKPVRYAVVGLGHIAQTAILPAFAHAKRHATLAALVSSDDTKLAELQETYGVSLTANYDGFDALLESGEIDAVYIATPNSEHRDFVERACARGVHVLCEKPLGVDEAECRTMMEAARTSGVMLMTAYRLHFEKATMRALELLRSGVLGEPRYFSSVFSMQVKEGNVRLDRELGGGALFDIGIYCINAARMIFESEPIEVHAMAVRDPADQRFTEVPMTVSAMLRFPDERLAQLTVSFGAASVAEYRVVGTKGNLRVEPAYEYAEGLSHFLTVGDGKPRTSRFAKRDQFAAELVYFSNCIRKNIQPEPDGEEGMLDLRVIDALQRSIRDGRPVKLAPYVRSRRPVKEQTIERPPVNKPPKEVHAEGPHS